MLEKLPPTVGEALSDVRAGLAHTLFQAVDLRQGTGALVLTSLAFVDHGPLPQPYTADGAGLSPPLQWRGVPAGASEVVLIVEDADSPTPQPLVHAIAHGLPADGEGAIAEAALSAVGDAEPLVAMGRNSLLQLRWLPPDPPPGHGVHRYLFQVFALSPGEALPAQPGRDALRQALQHRGLASGCLVGTYERSSAIAEPLAGAEPAMAVAS
jgi:Raf kinase inhibitor-like YbhB/YbcL family protein